MIYVIIGPSNSGKSTIVYNTFVKNSKVCEYYKDIIGITETDSAFIIGNFITDSRRRGTDTLARSDIKLISKQVLQLVLSYNKDIVIEGVRACSRPLINELIKIGEVRLVYLYCDVDTSIKRNLVYNPNSKVSYRAMQAAYTSAKNLYNDYRASIPSIIIDTTQIDFSTITIKDKAFSLDKSNLW